MQQIWRAIYTVILLFVVQIANAQSSTELSDLLKSVQGMKANFTQTLYDGRGKAKQTSYGNMAMQRPGKFRWEVTKPMPQLIIANQTTLWIFDPDLEQVTIRSLSKASGETPAFLLSDSSAVDAHYTVKKLIKIRQTGAGFRWCQKRQIICLNPYKWDLTTIKFKKCVYRII